MVIDALVAPFQVLVRQRPVITTFVQREIRTRYGSSALGLAWPLIRPLSLLALYTFVFSTVMNVRFGEDPRIANFALYLFCGLIPWLAFSDGLSRATAAIHDHASLVKRIRFPSEILPLHQVLVALAIESLGLVILLGALLINGRVPGWPLLALAAIVIPQFLFTTGLAWVLATLSVLLADTRQIVAFALMFWMYATPIVYPLDMVPPRLQWLFWLNPMTYVVEAYRNALLENRAPELMSFALFCAVSLTVFIAGYWVFQRSKYEFADVL
ncbi:MAG: ABC transporter permease [Vicinamibacterales bacterium]